jgi:hypothetical protein
MLSRWAREQRFLLVLRYWIKYYSTNAYSYISIVGWRTDTLDATNPIGTPLRTKKIKEKNLFYSNNNNNNNNNWWWRRRRRRWWWWRWWRWWYAGLLATVCYALGCFYCISIIRWQTSAHTFRVYEILLCQVPLSHMDIAVYKFTLCRADAS